MRKLLCGVLFLTLVSSVGCSTLDKVEIETQEFKVVESVKESLENSNEKEILTRHSFEEEPAVIVKEEPEEYKEELSTVIVTPEERPSVIVNPVESSEKVIYNESEKQAYGMSAPEVNKNELTLE